MSVPVDPEGSPGVRRLQAIMFTDVQGFSAMMQRDEARTIRVVREHREVVRGVLPAFEGREHETMGDGFLVLFDSALQAVRCGVEIQRQLAARNAHVPPVDRVVIRIGVHLGEVVFHEEHVYGEGVNLAARLEPQAPPGGLCISEAVHAQVAGRIDAPLVPMGVRPLKNIARPPSLWAIKPTADVAVAAPKRRRWPVVAALAVVLPALAFGGWRWTHPPQRVVSPRGYDIPVLSDDPWVEQRWENGLVAFVEIRGDEAQKDLDQVIAREPDLVLPHLARAVASTNPTDQATQVAAIEAAGKGDAPYADLARVATACFEAKDDTRDAAAAQVRDWLNAHPDDFVGQFLLMYLALGVLPQDEAAADLDHLVAIAPDAPGAWYTKALQLLRLNRLDEAEQAVDAGIAANPDSAALYDLRGSLLWQRRDWTGARDAFVKALQLAPANLQSRGNLADACARVGDEVCRQEQVAVMSSETVSPTAQIDFLIEHANYLLGAGRMADARPLTERLLRLTIEQHQAGYRGDFAQAAFHATLGWGLDDEADRWLDVMRDTTADPGMTSDQRQHFVWLRPAEIVHAGWMRRQLQPMKDGLRDIEAIPPDQRARVDDLDTSKRFTILQIAAIEGRYDDALKDVPAPDDRDPCRGLGVKARILAMKGDEAGAEQIWSDMLSGDRCGMFPREWLEALQYAKDNAALRQQIVDRLERDVPRADRDLPVVIGLTAFGYHTAALPAPAPAPDFAPASSSP